MTAPEDSGAGGFMGDLLQALPDALQRLRLLPVRRTGKVINGADPTNMSVVIDGDKSGTVVKNVYSMIGGLPAGTRVYIDAIPPSGQYVSGIMNPATPRNLVVDTTVSCDSPLSVGAGGPGVDAPISGLTVSVDNVPAGAKWDVTSFLDIRETVAGTTLVFGTLYVDGVAWTDPNTGSIRIIPFGVSAISDRASVGNVFSDTFTTPGFHEFEMQAQRTVAAGTQIAASTSSTMRVEVYT